MDQEDYHAIWVDNSLDSGAYTEPIGSAHMIPKYFASKRGEIACPWKRLVAVVKGNGLKGRIEFFGEKLESRIQRREGYWFDQPLNREQQQ